MTTLLATALISIAAASPPVAPAAGQPKDNASTIATILPTPGAGVLIAIGAIALLRARRANR